VRVPALAALLASAACACCGEPTNAVLGRLESALSEVRTVRTRFVQEKRMALFKSALVTRGVILVEMPDRLLWRVESPLRYALALDGKQARQWDGETGKTQRIPLDGNPVFAAVTEQLRAWFGGRYSLLARDYLITQTSESPPVFVFAPKADTPPAKILRSVAVTFREDRRYIAAIRIEEQSGDVTSLAFEDTEVNAPITAKEWEL
jgi:outer membrane lipoprotein carrier protein